MSTSTPTITLKLATSLDGRIALANGASQWITGSQSRQAVHALRSRADAIVTGIGTILADDPLMTARPDQDEDIIQPVRVVMDTRLRMPATAQILDDKSNPVLIFSSGDIPGHSRAALEEEGAEIICLNRFDGPSISFRSTIAMLIERGHKAIMIEAGGRLSGAAMRSGLVDRIEWFRAPVVLGGDGYPCFDPMGFERLDEAPIYKRERIVECGDDLHETYVRKDG